MFLFAELGFCLSGTALAAKEVSVQALKHIPLESAHDQQS
jgi:hypothetical protein